MPEIECRQAVPADAPGILAVKNSIFPPVTREDWDRETNKTTVVAVEGGRIVGAIPFALRPFRIAPGVVIRAAFENSVGVLDGRRGQGIGSAMIKCAAKFMRGRADALMVYRGDERSAAYRFYRRTGHVPVHRPGRLTRPAPTGLPGPATVLEPSAAIREAPALLQPVYDATWNAWSGFPERDENYWSRALDSYIFAELKHVPHLLRIGDAGAPRAYAVLCLTNDAVRIDEMAALSPGDAEELFEEILRHAGRRKGKLVVFTAGPASPFHQLYLAHGFAEQPRSFTIMARLLEPEAFLRLRVATAETPLPARVNVWTRTCAFALPSAPGATREVTLEMTQSALTRWALNRLDLEASIRHEDTTLRDASETDAALLSALFPLRPWIYHSLDDV